MGERYRAVCECGYRSEWLSKRFGADAECDIHAKRDECDGETAIQRKRIHWIRA